MAGDLRNPSLKDSVGKEFLIAMIIEQYWLNALLKGMWKSLIKVSALISHSLFKALIRYSHFQMVIENTILIQIQLKAKSNKTENLSSQGYLQEQHNFHGTKITYQIDNMSLSLVSTLVRCIAYVIVYIKIYFSLVLKMCYLYTTFLLLIT